MKMYVRWMLGLFAAGGILITMAGEAQARPSYGVSCRGCHGGTALPGLMTVTNFDGSINLDTINLPTATNRGEIKYYDVVRGNNVTLSMDVLDGAAVYSVQLKLLEKGGVMNNSLNKLVYTPDSSWTPQGTAAVPWFTKDGGNDDGILWTGDVASYTFDLFVDATTPVDVYNLEFTVGLASDGEPTRYGEEHFYLNVLQEIPEPSTWVLFTGFGVCLAWYGYRRRR